jgi:pyruvate dehydrogenase E1 component alpha subunit
MMQDSGIKPLSAYKSMVLMRRFEEVVGDATESGEIHGEMHLAIGQEAISAALIPLLQDGDAVVSTHRPHLHALAAGVDPVDLLAELFARAGLCHGKGGHMHLFDHDRSFMCTGIVGAGAPLAAGYAFEQSQAGGGRVTVCVLGDGAMNQGAFFETANLAALWRLPLLLLCEDNGYGISVRKETAAAGALEERGTPFGIPGTLCDGTDPRTVFAALKPAVARARAGSGPSLIVATCYRFRGHYEGDLDQYRGANEKSAAMSQERDPIARLRTALLADGASEDELNRIDHEAAERVEGWARSARERAFPAPETLREGLFV